ncbi:MAG: hypothetical protein V1820_04365 [archaeon]
MGLIDQIWSFLSGLPWDLFVAALFGFGIGFYLGKFFAEDSGEQVRFEYLSGKRRLRE